MRQPTNTRNSIALNSHRQPLVGIGSADDTKTLAEAIAQPATFKEIASPHICYSYGRLSLVFFSQNTQTMPPCQDAKL